MIDIVLIGLILLFLLCLLAAFDREAVAMSRALNRKRRWK